MCRLHSVLLCVLLVLSVDQITSKRTFSGGRHSYPKSGGLSGGGGHSYPTSGGLSGGGHGYPGGSHGYPTSGGVSGGGHGYPSPSGGSHGYPAQTNGHGYPPSKGLSGNAHSNTGAGHTTNIHNHYNYNPPQQIRYTPTHGGPPMSYPVYHGSPPTYVYQYKNSGSKYGTLLAGLALLNLGTLGVSAYALSKSHSNNYKPQPGEVCKFGVKKDNGDYEETKIDCALITSFIFEEQAKTQNGGTNATVITTSVTNVTTVNMTNGGAESEPVPKANPIYEMLPNGTLVPVNVTSDNTTSVNVTSPDGTVTSSVTITTTNTTTVTDALDVKGKPIDVTPGMKCFVMRHSPTSNMRKSVPCGLLQSYAEQSLKKNSASRNLPIITVITAVFAVLVAY